MIDLKRSAKERKDDSPSIGAYKPPAYPYWSSFTLEDKDVKGLPALKNAKGGEEVILTAKAKIERVETVALDENGKKTNRKTVTIQMQMIDIKPASEVDFDKAWEESK